MNIVAVVQARLSSSRLPAKILLDLGGKTALERCLERVRRFRRVSEVVVATSDVPADDAIETVGKRLGARVVRGSELDVLARYWKAAKETQADVVVRCTSDCPLLDPTHSSQVIDRLIETPGLDYAANVLERRLPRGLDTEVMTRDALERAHRDATAQEEREHVTMHIYRNAERFKMSSLTSPELPDYSAYRWTLDTLDDYRMLHALFERLGAKAATASLDDVLDILRREPAIALINSHVTQKA